MRLFVELATRAFKRALRYRAAALAGLVTNFFFGLLNASILVALLGERSSVAGFNAQGVITYTAISQALIAYLSMFGSYELMTSVYTGEVASDLHALTALLPGPRFWSCLCPVFTAGGYHYRHLRTDV